jgi:hypothetical protein
MPQLLALSLFLVWTHIWIFQGVGSVSQYAYCTKFKVIIGHTLFQLVYDIFLLMPIEYLLPMSNSHLDRNFFPTFIQNCQTIKLEHLDETWQEVANKTSIKKWNTSLWVQQNHKIKTFSMGDIIHWFPKGRKEHTEKFKKWWFGPYKIQYFLPNNIMLFVNVDKFWRTPKLLVRFRMSLNRSNSGIVWSSKHAPNSQH